MVWQQIYDPFGSPWLSTLMAAVPVVVMLAALAFFHIKAHIAALLALFSIRYLVNQVVLGVVLIALATGLTGFLLSQIPSDPGIKQYFN